MRVFNSIIVMSVGILISGCGTAAFTERKANPIIKSKIGTLDVAANTAARRNVYVRTNDTEAAKERRYQLGQLGIVGGRKGEMCAEPPPEAIEALVASFTAQAKAANAKGDSFEAGFERGLSTSIASTFKRSQGIQFYRDVAFTMCTSMLNGYIEPSEYVTQLWKIRDLAGEVMKEEFKTGAWTQPASVVIDVREPPEQPKAGG
mgnify:CR=1 FL=1